MANQRGIVAGWDATNSRPKGVTSAADMRASLQMIATHPGIMTEPGAATITLPSNAMRINWTAFTAVIRSTLGGWYTPRIEAGGIALSIGDATYARIDVVWVRQRDYQTNASWPDSEVEVGVAQGTPSATPSTPSVPTGALAAFTVRVPAGATTGSAIGLANVTAAARTAPAGGIITAASQAEMDAIAAAAEADNGLYVWRSDTQALMRHDGAAWRPVESTYSDLATLTNTILLGVSTMTLILSVYVPASAPPGRYRVDALTVTLANERLTHYWQVKWGTQTVTSSALEGMPLENLTRPAVLFFDHPGGAVTVTLAAQINSGDYAWNRAQSSSYLAVQKV